MFLWSINPTTDPGDDPSVQLTREYVMCLKSNGEELKNILNRVRFAMNIIKYIN